jgi:ubiquitin-protein ligase
MHSRTYLLIKRELDLLAKKPIDGINLEPIVDDQCFDLTIFFRPGKSSIWYGCMFRVFCTFDDTFNSQPPFLQFDSTHIPYHPNVDPNTGRIHLSLTQTWHSRLTFRSLLNELVDVFLQPNQQSIINSDAMRMWQYRPIDYRTIINDAIVRSDELVNIINEQRFPHTSTNGDIRQDNEPCE